MRDMVTELADLVRRNTPRSRVGVVTAINAGAGTCSVQIATEVATGLPWVGSTPPVGAKVLIERGTVVGVISVSPVTIPDPVTVVVPWQGQIIYTNETVGDSPPPRAPLGWQGPGVSSWYEHIQGNAPMRGDLPPYDPGVVWRLAMAVWDDPSTLIPSGATDARLSLRARRTPSWFEPDVSPALYGHAYTIASPGPTDTMPTLTHGPWRPGGLPPGWVRYGPPNEWGQLPITAMGDGPAATFPLPPDLQADLLSQTLTGLALWTERAEETSGFRLELLLSYTPPPDA